MQTYAEEDEDDNEIKLGGSDEEGGQGGAGGDARRAHKSIKKTTKDRNRYVCTRACACVCMCVCICVWQSLCCEPRSAGRNSLCMFASSSEDVPPISGTRTHMHVQASAAADGGAGGRREACAEGAARAV